MEKKEKRKNKGERKKNKSRFWHIISVLTKYKALTQLNPEKLKLMLEELGPTFVKLGQIMSTRPDILPLEYCKALEGLRTNVSPMPFETVEKILKQEWQAQISEVCESFEVEPIGSASIAQVHKAKLKTGEIVVVKVQRENIFDTMQKDIKLLKKASRFLKLSEKFGNLMDYNGFLDEMWRVTKEEIDFLHEAKNIKRFYENNKNIKYTKVPKVYEDFCCDRVLVMEYVGGISIGDIEKLRELEYDTGEIAKKLCDNYIKQVVEDGFYHADPHSGNIRIDDGKIVWLDMGMMGEFGMRERSLFITAIRALLEKDASTLKDICLTLGNIYGEIDHFKFYQDITLFLNRYSDMDLEEMDMMAVLNDLSFVARENKISIPKSFTMFGRGLVTLEGVINDLDATLNLMAVIKNYIKNYASKGFDMEKIKEEVFKKTYMGAKKTLEMPTLMNEYLKQWTKGQTKVGVEVSLNSKTTQRISVYIKNITLSLLMCALVLSGTICTLSTNLKYFLGLPIISWVFFGSALFIGFVLLIPIIKKIIKFFR